MDPNLGRYGRVVGVPLRAPLLDEAPTPAHKKLNERTFILLFHCRRTSFILAERENGRRSDTAGYGGAFRRPDAQITPPLPFVLRKGFDRQ